MKVFGIAGHSGMGKTTLLERLVPELRSRGLAVSLIKHSHKDIEIDRPGKDSFRLREAGCMEVLLLGDNRWALMHELRGAPEPSLDYLLDRMQACDLVLVEGFKGGDFPKLEVWRAAVGKPLLWPQWPGIVAVASDGALPTDASRGWTCTTRLPSPISCWPTRNRAEARMAAAGGSRYPMVRTGSAFAGAPPSALERQPVHQLRRHLAAGDGASHQGRARYGAEQPHREGRVAPRADPRRDGGAEDQPVLAGKARPGSVVVLDSLQQRLGHDGVLSCPETVNARQGPRVHP